MKRILGILAFCGLASLGKLMAAPPPYLKIGDPAPSISTARWIKGKPVTVFLEGNLYAVEFWATWCGPCKENIPHVTELAKKYKGKVTVIGMDVWESVKAGGGDALPKVTQFVKEQGAKMNYRVAADGPGNEIANTWMKAASENGIPCAFVVDRKGRVAWIGHPSDMEGVLKQEIAGTYDIDAAGSKREIEKNITRPIEVAMTAKNYPEAVKVIEAATEQRPQLKHGLEYQHLVALYHADLDKGILVSRKVLEESEQDLGAYQMMMAIFAVETDLSPAAYAFGKTLAGEVDKRGITHYLFLATKAELYFNAGDKAESVKIGELALAAAEKDPTTKPEMLALIKKSLEKHRAAL